MNVDNLRKILLYVLFLSFLFLVLDDKVFSAENQGAIPKKIATMDCDEAAMSHTINSSLDNIASPAIRENSTSKQSMGTDIINLEQKFSAFPEKSKITLTLRDMNVADVLRILAKEGGKNIVLDESVAGNISANLKNVSLNEAMEVVLKSGELEARVENNTIYVASRPSMARKGLTRKYIKAFKLNYANAVDVSKILEASIFNKGYVAKESAASKTASSSKASQQPAASNTSPNFSNPLAAMFPGMNLAKGETGLPSVADIPNLDQSTDLNLSGKTDVSGQTSTGQSALIASKKVRAKVDALNPGDKFNDASKLASEIAIQNVTSTYQDVDVNNNDGGAIVVPDSRTNSILVAGLEDDMLLVQEALKYLDKPLEQVAIDVSLVELSKDSTKNLGLSVAGKGGNFFSGFNAATGTGTALSASGKVGFSTAANESAFMFSTVKGIADNIAVKINALITDNKAKLLANPTVIALDGSESLVKITDQIVSRLVVTITKDGQTIKSPELSDIGIVLNILPKIGDDGYITMRVRPSITSSLGKVLLGATEDDGFATLISTREVILQDARVKTGETLAIAGLIKDSEIQKIGRLPFVSDLPVFGKLFTNTETERVKSELVILITPRIINDVAMR